MEILKYTYDNILGSEIITSTGKYEIQKDVCLYYKNLYFELKELYEIDGYFNPDKFIEINDKFRDRIYFTSIEQSINNMKEAINDFSSKNNFSIILGDKGCCGGYSLTKLSFDFNNDNFILEQDGGECYDNLIEDILKYSITEHRETINLIFEKTLTYLINKDLINKNTVDNDNDSDNDSDNDETNNDKNNDYQNDNQNDNQNETIRPFYTSPN